MGNPLVIVLLIGAVLTVVVIWKIISVYNRLVTLKNDVESDFSNIDVELKRRHNLIPNLVETAKGYMEHEASVLQNVTNARARAMEARENAADSPTDPDAINQLSQAESRLTGMIGNLKVAVEDYPNLKADKTMRELMDELSETENRIASERKTFNQSVEGYNTTLEVFPNNMIANFFRFRQTEFFEIEDESQREAPEVSF